MSSYVPLKKTDKIDFFPPTTQQRLEGETWLALGWDWLRIFKADFKQINTEYLLV